MGVVGLGGSFGRCLAVCLYEMGGGDDGGLGDGGRKAGCRFADAQVRDSDFSR